jgi:hypothetical protein
VVVGKEVARGDDSRGGRLFECGSRAAAFGVDGVRLADRWGSVLTPEKRELRSPSTGSGQVALEWDAGGSANREIHPAQPAGWSRVGVPGKSARLGRRPLQRFGKFFGISKMSERNVRPPTKCWAKAQRLQGRMRKIGGGIVWRLKGIAGRLRKRVEN